MKSLKLKRFINFNFIRPKSYYATTPIYYVNSKPHIGHLYTTALAEADVKWRKFYENKTTLLCTGCDEHGLKIWQAAQKQKLQPQQFCDQVSKK